MRLQTPLSMLRIYEPTLEEAYIDLLSRSDGAAAIEGERARNHWRCKR